MTPLSEKLEEIRKGLETKLRLVDQDRVARGKLLKRVRDMLVNPRDHLDDVGDLVSFGSTNDADAFRDAVRMLEDWRWDDIMREGKLPDLVRDCRKANRRADLAETRVAMLEAEHAWHPISTLPMDDRLLLAHCPPCADFPDGRTMIWRASILAMQGNGTPLHLRFPATHWRPLPEPPRSALTEGDSSR